LKPVPILPAKTKSVGAEVNLDPVASCTPRELLAWGPRTAPGTDTPSLTVGLLPRAARLSLDPVAKLRTLTRPLPEGEEHALGYFQTSVMLRTLT
jgi:hypothetical protein